MTLAGFQSAFAAAVLSTGPDARCGDALGDLLEQPGFAVYRNTVMKGCVDALTANYPAVARLVGADWFNAAARTFVRRYPPRSASLIAYGADFPAFLEQFPPAAQLPYLTAVARLDRAWTEAHVAADDARLPAAAIGRLPADELASAALVVHGSARWAWFADAPILSIWQTNHYDGPTRSLTDLKWRGEGALLTRPHGRVEAVRVAAAECTFLDACAAGRSIVQAGLDALDANPECDLSVLLQGLLRAGAFTRIESLRCKETTANKELT